MTETRQERLDGPVHGAFGLSYASYLVLPRSLLQEMPVDWQTRLVALLDEFGATWDIPAGTPWKVEPFFEQERPLEEYRHPDVAYINSRRRAPQETG